ncbi:hypothetical protein ACIRSS_23620 [Amycolatopsis sp. NPDC101161]|uniref:hypothetical protein n=1 Tax=Amycolatopsis sp. NPDC101161 TaxID=3363940 RepID=UPI00380818DE
MSMWKSLLTSPSHTWYLGRIADAPESSAVLAGETYVNVHLNTVHLEFSRRGTKKYYGVVGTSFELDSLAAGVSRFTGVHSPDWLAKVDGSNLDQVVQSDVRVLGPRPFIGGEIAYEIGLFAQPEADLAAPFIKLLTKISDAAGVSLLTSAGPIVPVVDAGIELLFGGDNATLQVGAAGTFGEPLAGTWALVKSEAVSGTNKVTYKAGRLRWPSGLPVEEPHLVFTIAASRQRSDWASIAELRAAWEDCRKAIRAGNRKDVDATLPAFRRLAQTSYDLLPQDGKRLAAWATQTAQDLLDAGPTSLGRTKDVPTLESFNLFAFEDTK